MKIIYFLFLSLLIISCKKKDEKICKKTVIIGEFCPKKGALLVEFEEPNPDATAITRSDGRIVYQAGLVNIPANINKEVILYM